jgi:hypothetical protein
LLLGVGVLVAAASHSWLFSILHRRLAGRLPSNVLALIQPTLLYTGLILAAQGFLGRKFASQMQGRAAAIATFAFAALIVPTLLIRWYMPLKLFSEDDSSRRLAATILSSPEKDLPIFGYYYFRTSLPFYLRRPVGLLSAEWGEMTSNYQVSFQAEARRTSGSRAGRGMLVTLPEFQALVKAPAQPLLVMTPNTQVESLWRSAQRIDPLWSEWDFSIWEILPTPAPPAENQPARIVTPFRP